MSVFIALFRHRTQIPESEYLRRTRGVHDGLELVLWVDGLGAALSPKVINRQRMMERARRRSTGMTYNGYDAEHV